MTTQQDNLPFNLDLIFTSEAARKAYGTEFYKTDFSAGIDLRAAIDEPITILTGEQNLIPTGIKIDMMSMPLAMAGIIIPRSGRGSNEGLTLGNMVGLIDQDYHGDMQMCLWARPTSGYVNGSNNRMASNPIHIEPWERVAQLVFVPVIVPTNINVVEAFRNVTERGEGGHGSTGNG